MTALAIGAASPLPLISSRVAAGVLDDHGHRDLRVVSAGANDTNQACGGRPAPCCAVPVLPATLTPGICAVLPGAVLDDRDHHLRSGRRRSAGSPPSLKASGLVLSRTSTGRARAISSTRYGFISTPPLAIAGADHRHLQRGGPRRRTGRSPTARSAAGPGPRGTGWRRCASGSSKVWLKPNFSAWPAARRRRARGRARPNAALQEICRAPGSG